MTIPSILPFTGERFTPECLREMNYEHWHRYYFARHFVQQQRVLDIACGEGFGSHLLAKSAAQVIGIDIDPVTIQHAQQRYGQAMPNLNYQVGTCTQIPLPAASVDVVVSFETLEHIEGQALFLAEIRRVLTPAGFLIISSPNKSLYSDAAQYHNPYHVRELYRPELEALLASQFPAICLLGQKLLFHSAIWALEQPLSPVTLMQHEYDKTTDSLHHEAMYFLAICAQEPQYLPAQLEQRLWLYDDAAESVYAHYNQVVRELLGLTALYQQQQAELAALKKTTAPTLPPTRWQQLWQRGRRWLGLSSVK